MKILTARVIEPDKDDYKERIHVIKYLQSASNVVLILESDGFGTIKWWVDTAFTVHHGMKIQRQSNVKGAQCNNIANLHIKSAPSHIIDSTYLPHDYYLNLLSWSDTNILGFLRMNVL